MNNKNKKFALENALGYARSILTDDLSDIEKVEILRSTITMLENLIKDILE